jgi:hypothetical protein
MEEDSIEDGALRDYFKKGKERKERKKRKKERAARDQGKGKEKDASGEQGEENHEGKQVHSDPSQLIYLNPSKEGISQNNQTGIANLSLDDSGTESESGSVSPFPPSKSVRNHKVNLDDEEDLLELNFSSPERISPPPPAGLSDDGDTNGESSSNQADGRFIYISFSRSIARGIRHFTKHDHANHEQHETSNAERVAAREGEILYKGAPILTVETFNQIVKASKWSKHAS